MNLISIIVIVILLMAAVAVWWWRRKANADEPEADGVDISAVFTLLPSLDLKWAAGSIENWKSRDRLMKEQQLLEKAGFSHVGFFRMDNGVVENPYSLWNHQAKGLSAAYYLAKSSAGDVSPQFVIELLARTVKGQYITVSNFSGIAKVVRPKNTPAKWVKVADTKSLYSALKSLIQKVGPLQGLNDDFFAEEYFNIQLQVALYNWQKDALLSERFSQKCQSAAIEFGEEHVEILSELSQYDQWKARRQDAICSLRRRVKMSQQKWLELRPCLLPVFENMPPQVFVSIVNDILGAQRSIGVSGDLERIMESETFNPMLEFKNILKATKSEGLIKKVTTMDSPHKVDFYRLPHAFVI